MSAKRLARVLFPKAVPEPFDYELPGHEDVCRGAFVLAPLGKKAIPGVVWEVRDKTATDEKRTLKTIEAALPVPPLPENTLKFIDFVARYTCHLQGVVLRMVMSNTDALAPSPIKTTYTKSHTPPARMTPAREKVLGAASDTPLAASELARLANVSVGVVKALAEAGGLNLHHQDVDQCFNVPDLHRTGLTLTASQQDAASALITHAQQGSFATALLDGVTGSGKTEVYFEAIEHALKADADAQVLVLLPEIALTQDVLARFARRFGAEPAQWHSERSAVQRRRVWREVAKGRARIVVGARSALFLPFAHLRLIVVDEEHDSSYKQEEGVLYHARDMAVARAKFANAPVILASATPSLESLSNTISGRYSHVRLAARPGAATLPPIHTIDLREHPPEARSWLSPPLIEAMHHTLARNEQCLLFLNRRGYAPLTLCRQCGERMKAPDSDTYLVEHRNSGRLVCHLTGFSMPKPKACPACGAPDSLHPVGPGVERLHEEVCARFADARIEVFSSDTASTAAEVSSLIGRMEAGDIDILIGTQMAAKGHNFPHLTLVGVVDADMGLHGADLRAGERTWQTLMQVAGRAGRADKPGRAFLQTHQPDHEAILALCAGQRDAFVAAELGLREDMGFPPFGRLAALIFSAPSEQAAQEAAYSFVRAAPMVQGVDIWGPSEPPLARVRGRWRRRLLLRAGKNIDLSAMITAWRARIKLPGNVRLKVDIDPYSFL
jgi:primosomal protein N' (replication factor Y) (superfamily II helicase)